MGREGFVLLLEASAQSFNSARFSNSAKCETQSRKVSAVHLAAKYWWGVLGTTQRCRRGHSMFPSRASHSLPLTLEIKVKDNKKKCI